MKWNILLMVLLMIPIVNSIPQCEDRIEENQSCEVITPIIGCTLYNYNITNTVTGARVLNESNLTAINSNIYKLEFNQTAGEYLITLCSDHTTTIRVNSTYDAQFKQERLSRMSIAIGILVGTLIIVFGAFTLLFNQLELKVLFGYLTGLMIIFGFRFGALVVQAVDAAQTNLINIMNSFYGIAIVIYKWLFFALMIFYLIRFWKIIEMWKVKKLKQQEEGWMYD